MGAGESSGRRKRARLVRQIGMLTTIPFLLAAGPLVGGGLGHWMDDKLGTSPWLALLGVLLGLAAGVRQCLLVLRQAGQGEEEQ